MELSGRKLNGEIDRILRIAYYPSKPYKSLLEDNRAMEETDYEQQEKRL